MQMYCLFMVIGGLFFFKLGLQHTVHHQVICNHYFKTTHYISHVFFLLTVFLPNRKEKLQSTPTAQEMPYPSFVCTYPLSTLYK